MLMSVDVWFVFSDINQVRVFMAKHIIRRTPFVVFLGAVAWTAVFMSRYGFRETTFTHGGILMASAALAVV